MTISRNKARNVIRQAASNWLQALHHMQQELQNEGDEAKLLGIQADIEELEEAFKVLTK